MSAFDKLASLIVLALGVAGLVFGLAAWPWAATACVAAAVVVNWLDTAEADVYAIEAELAECEQ